MKLGAIEMSDGSLRALGVRHFDKRETARLTRIAVGDDIHPLHAAIGGKCVLQILLSCLVTEVPDKNIGHSVRSFSSKIIFVRLH